MIEKGVLYRDPKWWDPELSKLDIYYRPSSEKKAIVIFVHGGGWKAGDKSYLESKPNILNFFLDLEFVVVSVNFRLVDDTGTLRVSYRHQAEDLAYAIKWLSENIENYGGLNDQFILVGYSSGAHLSSLVATDTSYLKNEGLSIESIRGVIALDIPTYDVPFALDLMKGSSLEANIPFNEAIFGKDRKEQMKGSPSSFVFNSRMPFLLVSTGIKDGKPQSVTKDVTEYFKNLLIKSGHHALHLHDNNHSHSSFLLAFGKKGSKLSEIVESFIKRSVGNVDLF